MPSKLQRAKQLFENEQYAEAKQLLLEVINSGDNTHYSLYEKLGDISHELNQYDDSLKYYLKSMNKNAENPSIYIKLGDLYHEHLNNTSSAIEMYEECLQLYPENERCWFNYGKLSFKLQNYSKSEECFKKCLTPRACVKYHYALLLLNSCKPISAMNKSKALKLLQRATKLKPNIFRYHYEYALCLRDMNQSKNANHQFNIALTCIENQQIDGYNLINFYYEYAIFLSEYYSKYNTSLKYLQIAIDLDVNKEYKYVLDEYNNLNKHILSISKPSARAQISMNEEIIIDNNLYHPNIKLIIYSFEQCITYNKLIDIDFNKVQLLKKITIINEIFGGDDRIDRLHIHFQRIVTSRNNIRLGIICAKCDKDVMIELLGRVGLIKYFDKFDVLTSCNTNNNNNLLTDIEILTNKYSFNMLNEVLYIDNKEININYIANNCISYHVYCEQKILLGLNIKCLKEIELIVGVYIKDEYDIITNKIPTKKKLKGRLQYINEINKDIYWKIKRQIGELNIKNKYDNNNNNNNNNNSIDNLQIIQWIRKNWKNKEYKQHFLYFAKVFKIIRQLPTKGFDWTNANMLPNILLLAPSDGEIQRRYAKCLAFLGHFEQAEIYFQNAINNSRHFLHRMEYAYFLLKQNKYLKAEIYFKQCINITDKEQNKTKLYIGYAKCLQGLNKSINQIEKYYKFAIDSADNKYDDISIIHYQLANYLFKKKKYKKSKYQFEIALKYKKDSINYHYGIAKVLNKMKLYQKYKYHLNKILQMDKNHSDANHDLNQLNLFLSNNNNNNNNNYNENDDNESLSDDNQQQQQIEQNQNGNYNYNEEKKNNNNNNNNNNDNSNVFNEQFNRFWFDGINIQNNSFNRYFDGFEANGLNDINVILFDTEIQNKLTYKINVYDNKDIKIIMDKVNNIRNDHKIFRIKLNEYKLKKCYNIFANSAIYTCEALINSVKYKGDIIKLIRFYNKDIKDRQAQFDDTDANLIQRIWNFIQKVKQNGYN